MDSVFTWKRLSLGDVKKAIFVGVPQRKNKKQKKKQSHLESFQNLSLIEHAAVGVP